MSILKANKLKTGIESLSFLGPELWNTLSEELKKHQFFSIVQIEIEKMEINK